MLESGLVNSLARPDGNTTRVSILVWEAEGKRLDFLIEAVPRLRLMAVLTDVNYTAYCEIRSTCCPCARYSTVRFWPSMTWNEWLGERVWAILEEYSKIIGPELLGCVDAAIKKAT